MFDMERITHIIGDMEKYFTDMKELEIEDIDDLDDKRNFYSLSMLLFSILNRAIDLGEEIIAGKRLGVPSRYRDVFKILAQNKIIGKTLEKQLSDLVFYRNLLSHEYHDLSVDDVFDVFKRIDVVRRFVEAIKVVARGK